MYNYLRSLFQLFVMDPFVRVFLGLNATGARALRQDRPVVVVANHNSHLDTAVLLSLIGHGHRDQFRPVAADDYFGRIPIFSYLVRLFFDILPIRRGAAGRREDPIAQMEDAVAGGTSLILFPEGTRGEPEVLSRFHTGVGVLLARHPELTVIPVHLRGLGRVMPRGTWYPVPFVVDANVGEPMQLRGDPARITAQIEAEIRRLGGEAPVQALPKAA